MHQRVAPAVDAAELLIGGGGQGLAVCAQHYGLVDAVAVLSGQADHRIKPSRPIQRAAQGLILGHLAQEGLQISDGHGTVSERVNGLRTVPTGGRSGRVQSTWPTITAARAENRVMPSAVNGF